MDDFLPSDLVWFVAVDPGTQPRPVVVLAGDGAQALVETLPDLFRLLTEMRIPERSFLAHSRHAEVLLLHTREEPARSIAYHYGIARELVADLWERETPTPPCERAVEPPRPGWLQSVLKWSGGLPPVPRRLRPCPGPLFGIRFPVSGPPASVIDRAVWIDALGRHDKGQAMLEERLREAPDDGLAHYRLGSMLAQGRRQWEEGIIHLRRAAELNPEQPLVWNDLGMALNCAGHAAEALAAATREAELSNDFGAWMNVALSCLTLKRALEAGDAARRAQEIDPNDPVLLFLLSVCARRQGSDMEAGRFLAQAERALLGLPPATRKALDDAGLDVIKEARGSK